MIGAVGGTVPATDRISRPWLRTLGIRKAGKQEKGDPCLGLFPAFLPSSFHRWRPCAGQRSGSKRLFRHPLGNPLFPSRGINKATCISGTNPVPPLGFVCHFFRLLCNLRPTPGYVPTGMLAGSFGQKEFRMLFYNRTAWWLIGLGLFWACGGCAHGEARQSSWRRGLGPPEGSSPAVTAPPAPVPVASAPSQLAANPPVTLPAPPPSSLPEPSDYGVFHVPADPPPVKTASADVPLTPAKLIPASTQAAPATESPAPAGNPMAQLRALHRAPPIPMPPSIRTSPACAGAKW